MFDLSGDNWSPLTCISRVGLALGLGLLIGMERERAGKEIGVRTFALTSLMGALGWMVSPLLGVISIVFASLLAILVNIQTLLRNGQLAITTAVCLFLTVQIGALVGLGQTFAPTAAAFLLVACLSAKKALVNFSLKLTKLEIRSALTLGIISFVVYPLLPDKPIDPWGVINLQSAWLTVIMISTISFGNYILLKLYGARGIAYTGFLGGLVSSTVTVAALATNLKTDNNELNKYALKGIRLANLAMVLRNGVILIILAPSAALYALASIGLMSIINLLLTFDRNPKRAKEATWEDKIAEKEKMGSFDLGLTSPFSLKSACKYGLLFLAITVFGEFGQRFAGVFGFYVVSFIGGFVSSASTSASAANMAATGKIEMGTAAIATLLASVASSSMQLVIASKVGGNRKITWKLGRETCLMLLAGSVGLVLQTWLQA